jgi:hypothetical protein
MIAALTNHRWQSTLFAFAAGLATLTFRHNRAQVRYRGFSASVKFFIPLALRMKLGSHFRWALAANEIAMPAVSPPIEGRAAVCGNDVVHPGAASSGLDSDCALRFVGVWIRIDRVDPLSRLAARSRGG